MSVSVSAADVVTLDEYAAREGLGSRSAAVQAAIGALRERMLGDEYEAAWQEWATEEQVWDSAVADGLEN